MRIENIEDIRDVFSIFHDGGIVDAEVQTACLVLKVEIQYLAERISPQFSRFTVRLYDIQELEFFPWSSDAESAPEKISDPELIFQPELDILEAAIKGNKIEVICNQPASEYAYCGGELLFYTNAATVQDEAGKFYGVEELGQLCKGYWDEWAAKNH